ncbi:MAG TPA: hypothetical protein VJ995_08430, partial [Geothermobacteraceae bacterium]|nr:hypothetical protein [Geothermobacteraceae bacterium]
GRLRQPLARTLSLLGLFAACLVAALQPIFVSGGHGSSSSYSLLDFVKVLGDFRIPQRYVVGYFSLLGLLLLVLLTSQHLATRQPALSLRQWQRRRRLRRRVLTAGVLILLLSLGWTHRTLLIVKPLADLGLAPAQYQLALVLREESIKRHGRPGGGYQAWLVKAAEQGHLKAAQELVLHPRNRAEKLRWLTVAAEGGMADAQYQLYRELRSSSAQIASARSALDWLRSAAEQGQPDAQFELGSAYLAPRPQLDLPTDATLARSWWERAAENGHSQAMRELAWRYEQGADGFPRDAQRAIELHRQLAAAYESGTDELKPDPDLAADQLARAAKLTEQETQLAAGDPAAQAELGHQLLQVAGGSTETRAAGLRLLEQAASQGDAELQYELGGIFLFGRHGVTIDQPRGRDWWGQALAQNHVATMEYVAPAYQNGRFGYPVDLLQSKALVEKLVAAYRDGRYGVDPDPARFRHWSDELNYFDRLFELAGGDYQSPVSLQRKAEAGDTQAQYQLGRQLLVSGPEQRRQGLQWIERAAEGGYAEAQYRLVTSYENQLGIMKSDPTRGVALLSAATAQHHLPAMSALALGYEKGRYGLQQSYAQAAKWYRRVLEVYESGHYLGEIDARFVPFNRSRLAIAEKLLQAEQVKAERYANASPLERQVIAIEERYHRQYVDAVNALPRGNGTREGKLAFREKTQKLLLHYNALRDAEIARLRTGEAVLPEE